MVVDRVVRGREGGARTRGGIAYSSWECVGSAAKCWRSGGRKDRLGGERGSQRMEEGWRRRGRKSRKAPPQEPPSNTAYAPGRHRCRHCHQDLDCHHHHARPAGNRELGVLLAAGRQTDPPAPAAVSPNNLIYKK